VANIRNWILAFAIAIMLNLFINYGISVFYKAPQYDDFCKDNYRYDPYPAKPYGEPYTTQQNCSAIEVSEALQESCNQQKGYIGYKYNSAGCSTEAYCETCDVKFRDIDNKRSSNIFIILVVFGVAAIIIGMVMNAEAVANGLLIGGILSLIIAAIRNWGQLSDVLRFVVLGIVLVILIWVGYKKGMESGMISSQSKKQKHK